LNPQGETMVDIEDIKQKLKRWFHVRGPFIVDSSSGLVTVHGAVQLKYSTPLLPVKFAEVDDDFLCARCDLTTLEGSPEIVGGQFLCGGNLLTDLKGAPSRVGYFNAVNNPLTSLDGAPDSVGSVFAINYNPQLPLLRVLQYKYIKLWDAPPEVDQILLKYAGTGKRGLLGAGVELTKAGLKANARW
jgi:hypothetical protein